MTLRETARLRSLAQTVREDGEAGTFRLLERISERDDAQELRDTLVMVGADRVLEDARATRATAQAIDASITELRGLR